MKNPDSFQLEDALFMPDGSACYTYRARNSFNAIDRGAAVFDGTKLVTSDEKRIFKPIWKKLCEGKSGEDISAYVRMFVL
ncbi:hypothetical protein HHL11_07035 [Ramlibacter sp. G-1-2-2]|uniref:Uncharacterized protein n=2 Tax=Ramlibacter agri TaxID=2728837 RepID=A0A848GXU6_9BURK|nr:hypothetical protein [Ramlibacter agri]